MCICSLSNLSVFHCFTDGSFWQSLLNVYEFDMYSDSIFATFFSLFATRKYKINSTNGKHIPYKVIESAATREKERKNERKESKRRVESEICLWACVYLYEYVKESDRNAYINVICMRANRRCDKVQ